MDDPEITVIGGGVIGLTAATTLQLRGHDTRIIADRLAYRDQAADPRFASAYGAGAVFPHAIEMQELDAIYADSRAIYDRLRECGVLGVRKHQQYWIDEDRTRPPDMDHRPDQQPLTPAQTPLREGTDAAAAWTGSMLFADMPRFMTGLYDAYEAIGGRIDDRTLDRDDLQDLDGLVLNCTGLRAPELFDDPAPYQAVQGHLVRVEGAPFPRGPDDEIVSYVYEAAGDHRGAYCFPQMGGPVIGGTHRSAAYHPGEEPAFGPLDEPTTEIDGTTVPQRIIDCNRTLLDQLGVDIDGHPKQAMVGYRPLRDPDGDGARLELAEEPCGRVIHSYGHGGAGITVAWGAAVRTTRLTEDCIGRPDHERAIPQSQSFLNQLRRELDACIRGEHP